MLTMSAHRRYATADSAVLEKKKPAFTNRGKPGFKTQGAFDSP